MVAALNVPEAKLKKKSLDSAAQRVTTLKAELGEAPALADIKQAILKGFAERLGITHYVVRDAEQFAPVVAALS